jgi:16S rRNA (guanine966-N2)-methyltransferase
MRVIGGIYGGRRYPEKLPAGIRPTTDSARETIFNILQNNIDIEGISVLDLFSGTGALGIEALSHGAGQCHFIEKNRQTSDFIGNICQTFHIPKESVNIMNIEVMKFLRDFPKCYPETKFDLVFSDPPYANYISNTVLKLINEHNLLKQNGIFVAEHSFGETLIVPPNWELLTYRIFGETRVDFLKVKKLEHFQ